MGESTPGIPTTSPDRRPYDLVLFGATGFAGGLTARYLARHAPASIRWALAGRNRARLEAVRAELDGLRGEGVPSPELLRADVVDANAMRALAMASRVVATTVGPFGLHGEPLVAACALAGTDYVDLTGEPGFVDRMWLAHHERARRSGARLVHCCGFESIPPDLGTYFTVKHLPEGVPLSVDCFVRLRLRFSGGSYRTAIHSFAGAGETLRAAWRRRRLEQRPAGRKIRSTPSLPRHDPALGGWVVPFPTIDGRIVCRSAAALGRYGLDFGYGHHIVAEHLGSIAVASGGLALGSIAAQLPPTRELLLRAKSPGEGPSEEARARGWFELTFVGEGGGKRVVTKVCGGDPGYTKTAKFLAESGLCLAFDDLAPTSGQVTPVQAMGDALLERLQRTGTEFRVRASA